MKLATYKDGSRDGQLVVVARDLGSAHYATGIATRLQQVLDDWNFHAPQLHDLSETLNAGKARHAFAFDPRRCMAPLPRAYRWAEASAYLDRVERLRKAGEATMPPSGCAAPSMYPGASDDFLGPCDDIVCPDPAFGIDFGAGIAVVTGDVAMGSAPEVALEGVRLVMLANSLSLHERVRAEQAKDCLGFPQRKPATAFSPLAITPDELGDAWAGGRVHLTLRSDCNGRAFGRCDAGPEMTFHFGELIAHLCKTRPVRAGSIVGSGPVSNRDGSKGCSCIAEQRAIETLERGAPQTGFMRHGDTLRIDMPGRDGRSLFGAIEQRVAPPAQAS